MSGRPGNDDELSPDELSRIELVCDEFESAWRSGIEPHLEQHLDGFQGAVRTVLLRELLHVELTYRLRAGFDPRAKEYVERFPADETIVRDVVETVLLGSPGKISGSDPTLSSGSERLPHAEHSTATPEQIGAYQVLEEIARGGMGIVYKARDQNLRRIVAVKMILAGSFASEAEVQRFYSEATIAAQLDHPGIVPVYDVGQYGNQHYFSMGYVEGASLAHRIAGGPLPEREAAQIVAALGDAVQYAHDKGIIHRDLKPQNVLMTGDNQPRITDFGLAKGVCTDSSLTATGQVLGTPSYMPPEQARGQRAAVGKHSDIYSLGAVLYCLITGRAPFESPSAVDTLRLVLEKEPLRPRLLIPTLSSDMETICLKCLAKEPEHRYSTAGDLAEDLRRFLRQEPIAARPVGPLTRLWRWGRRKPLAAGLCLALVAVALSLVVAAMLARKASNAIDLAELTQRFEADLDSPSLSTDYLEKMELLIGNIERYDPVQAESASSRLMARFAEHVREQILRRKLTEQDVADLQAAINRLMRRNSGGASELASLLQSKRRDWQDVFRLSAPFEDVDAIWKEGLFRPQDGRLELADAAENRQEAIYLPTRVASQGDVALDAIFAPPWITASRLGLALHGDDGTSDTRDGYQFVLRTVDQQGDSGPESQTTNRLAEIRRDGVRLRMRRLSFAGTDDQPLHLHAERDGNRLIFQVNQQEPLVVEELFSPVGGGSGWLAVELPAIVGLQQLTASRKSRSEAVTVLEMGDQLFAAGQFAEAHRTYSEQANTIDDEEVRHEARFKQGLSLMELKRLEEARELFEKLVADRSKRWSPLATCQLWLLQLQAGRIDEADRIFETVSYTYRFEELAVLVPSKTRQKIVKAYSEGVGGGLNATRPNPHRIERLERLVEVQRLLDASHRDLIVATENLMEAYHWENQLDQAEQTGRTLLAEPGLTSRQQCFVLGKLTWVLIGAGRANELLDELDQRLFIEKPDSIRKEYVGLFIDRARILAAADNFQEADSSMNAFFSSNVPVLTSDFIGACLLKGFLCEELGKPSIALNCWRQGFQVARDKKRLGSLPATILGSVTNDYTLEDARQTLRGVVTANSDSLAISFLQRRLAPDEMIHTMLRNMWQEPTARAWARKYALRQVSAAEADYMQMHFAANEIWRQCVTGAPDLEPPLTPQQEKAVFGLSQLLWQAWLDGQVSEVQIVQAAMAWRGTYSVFGWSGLAPSLDVPLRYHFAYVFGCRFKHLQKQADAAKLFQAVLRDAPPDSELRRLAEEELKKLESSTPLSGVD